MLIFGNNINNYFLSENAKTRVIFVDKTLHIVTIFWLAVTSQPASIEMANSPDEILTFQEIEKSLQFLADSTVY